MSADQATAVIAAPAADSDLPRLERALVRVLRGAKTKAARHHGQVEGAGYLLLASLETNDRMRLSDLAAVLHLDTSTVSRQVRGLEDAGMVRREPDPDDRRACRLAVTETGRHEVVLQRRDRHAVLGHALSNWSADDRDQLLTLLQRLALDVERSPTRRT